MPPPRPPLLSNLLYQTSLKETSRGGSSPCLQPPSSSSSYFLGARWTPITGPSITRGLTGSYALPLIGVDLLRVLAFYGQGCTPPQTSFPIGPG